MSSIIQKSGVTFRFMPSDVYVQNRVLVKFQNFIKQQYKINEISSLTFFEISSRRFCSQEFD